MSESTLSFSSSSTFRNQLIVRNLPPYKVPGVYSPPSGNVNYETNLTVSSVIDSPDTLIATNNLANNLYPLNEYGPEGGFTGKYTIPAAPYPVDSNSGPYNPTETKLDILNEFFIDAAYIQNVYGPEGGYNDMVTITDIVGSSKLYKPYWDPQSFNPSSYSTYDLIFSENPTGSNGPLSQDTYLAKIGATTLKSLFEERIAAEITKNTIGRVNLSTLEDPFTASLIASGKQPFFEKNWSITQPENPVGAATSLATRLTGTYFPVSLIPGDYFNGVEVQSPKLEKALEKINPLTGGLLGPILDVFRNPSETFVANTGNGQRSILFGSLDYNKYRPKYTRGPLQSITTGLDRILDPNKPDTGGYYVGSPEAEPSRIDSPANQVPVGPGGKQLTTIVYGPQELGILYEGNQNKIVNGLAGKTLSDGGGIAGQFVWTSPKYKPNAGFKVGVGGDVKSLDGEYNVVKSDYEKYQSTDISFKEGSILDQTQRLVNSADNVQGETRLKHVGNAINQVSKVFNDGYKEMTKGSKVLSYKDNAGENEVGIEYCRVFTKDTPYYTYADLQKSDGITTSGRTFTHSVFDNTYNLNIAPLKNPGSTNIVNNKVKKYMFSIENLAWRTSDRPGLTYDDLPVCERGPNGGRIMWFPPYDLTFSDESQPNFNETTFLGRPEPIYTYKNTSRSGSLSWKIIVDHPAVMNTIVQKQLKNVAKKEQVDSMVESFFAGCLKYDLYELGIKFNTIPTRDLYTYQQVLNNPRLTSEELGKVAFEIPQNQTTLNTNNAAAGDTPAIEAIPIENKTTTKDVSGDFDKYKGYGFYFDNNAPNSTTGQNTYGATATNDFKFWYDAYVAKKSSQYVNMAPETVYLTVGNTEKTQTITYNGTTTEYKRDGIQTFFSQVVEGNYSILSGEFLDKVKDILKNDGKIEISLLGSASATASVGYNLDISKRRNDSVKLWLEKQDVSGTPMKKYIDDGKLVLKFEGAGEQTVIPKVNGGGDTNLLSASVDCTINVREKIGANQYKRTSAAEWYSIPPMACRRVVITDIKAEVKETVTSGGGGEQVTTTTTLKDVSNTNNNPSSVIKPTPNITVEQKIKDGISKKILRFLFSECDYFEALKEDDPMIFQSIKDKIKYFNPAFHSATPEGLNSRLTFLNQCVRPGQTIPIIGADGRPKYNDALNTSFGAPPILVLRVGDFYHSKIVPKNLNFSYEEAKYDLNPEGIGVQPMIVKVQLGFNFIGGHGLKNPVDELQNALSFNFYANTEVYDERATATEDVSVRDKYVVEQILSRQPTVTTNNVQNVIPKLGGSTIGNIISNTEIDYTQAVNTFWTKTVEYFDSVINTNTTITKTNNVGIMDLLFIERNYLEGKFDEFNSSEKIEIYGKPKNIEDRLNSLFDRVNDDISKRNDPFMLEINKSNITESDKRKVENKLKEYVTTIKDDFVLNLTNNLTSLTTNQQDYVQFIRKFNLLLTKTDGSLNGNNQPNVYNLSGTTNGEANTFDQLKSIYTEIKNKHIKFFNTIVKVDLGLDSSKNIYNKNNSTFINTINNEPKMSYFTDPSGDKSIAANRFYQVMSQVFISDDNTKLLSDFLNDGNYKLKASVEYAITKAIDICKASYNNYTKQNNEIVSKIKDSQNYKDLIKSPIEDNVTYKLTYTTTDGTAEQKQRITDLYSTNNINTKFETFDGKIKFN